MYITAFIRVKQEGQREMDICRQYFADFENGRRGHNPGKADSLQQVEEAGEGSSLESPERKESSLHLDFDPVILNLDF